MYDPLKPEAGPVAHAHIVHWNRPDQCARTATLFLSCPRIAVRVFDNGSKLDDVRRLKSLLPRQVNLIELGANLGWGAAHNRGLAQWLVEDTSEFCFLSAHDAQPQGSCPAEMIRIMRECPRLGLLCPQFESSEIGIFTPVRGPRVVRAPRGPCGVLQDVDFAHGTLSLVRRKCVKEIGCFDERYFAYGDEIELGLRARRHGWRVAQLWGAYVLNPETSTPRPLVAYLCSRNFLLLARDYGGAHAAVLRAVLVLANSVRMLLQPPRERGSIYYPAARFRAVFSFFTGEYGAPPERYFNSNELRRGVPG